MTDTVEKGEATVYEAAFHIDAHLSETEVQRTFTEVKEAIARAGGVLVAEAAPVRLDLAYTISIVQAGSRRDHTTAHFAWIAYELSPEAQGEIEETLRSNPNIIRSLVTITTKEEALLAQERALESLMTKKKADDEEVSDEELDEAIETATST